MLFNSYDFMLFFPIVIFIYFTVPKKIRYIWLLLCSYYFYMGWNPKYALLIAISTIITYFSGILLDKLNTSTPPNIAFKKKWVVAGSFITNIGILVFFKYFDFILQNLNSILDVLGIAAINKPFDIILPVGISFYTFQALSYTMDVYQGKITAERNIFRYALFVSFFPQLVAGPIERSKNLLKQIDNIENLHLWNYENITHGIILMLYGLFQKMVIADRAAIIVDNVYDCFWIYGSIELIFATILFGIQVYCDFSSYSLIAMGAAKVMGFNLMENFNTPYFSRSIKEFWRRWHISLSTWFRDYLYIPLGGNRYSKIQKYRNLLITFLISGLWHGANWSFIIWGGLHGIYQIIGDLIKPIKNYFNAFFHVKTESFSYKFGQMLITFVLVDFAWIFFRMNSLKNSIKFIYFMIIKWNPWVLFNQTLYTLGLDQKEMHILLIALCILLLIDFIRYKHNLLLDVFLETQCLWFKWGSIFFLFFFIIIYGIYGPEFDSKQFIYFQF